MARLIQFEGRQIEMPDDATDDEVASVLSRGAAPAGPQMPEAQSPPVGMPTNVQGLVPPIVQGGGAGAAELAGFLPDVAGAGANAILWGADKALQAVGGPELPFRFPGTSASIKNVAGNTAGAMGFETAPYETMSTKDKLLYNTGRFGTQALGALPALAKMGATRAAEIVAGSGPKMFDALVRPYMNGAVRPLVGDAAATVGTAAATTQVDESSFKDSPVAQTFAAMAGGVGGGALAAGGEAAGRAAGRAIGKPFGFSVDRPVTGRLAEIIGQDTAQMDPAAYRPTTKRTADSAAAIVQSEAVDRPGSLQRMEANRSELLGLDPRAPMPSPAALAEDPGLAGLERAVALSNQGTAATKQREFASSVRDTVDRTAPPGSDAQQLIDRVQRVTDTRNEIAQKDVDLAAGRERGITVARQRVGEPLRTNTADQANASGRLDEAVRQPYTEARAAKNEAFNAIDPTRTRQVPADDVIAAAGDVRDRVNVLYPQGQQIPGEFVEALERLAPRVVDGINVGGPGTVALGDLVDARPYLSKAQETAVRDGNFKLADSISALRQAINRTVEQSPDAAVANAQYREFADRYRPNPSDEGAKFTREVDRRKNPPPSETAGRFLSSPEKAQALNRILADSPSEAQGQAAVRDYLRSDFALLGVNPDGTLNTRRATAWARKNADVLAQFPQVRQEFDDLVRQAQRGDRLAGEAGASLNVARRNAAQTQAQIDRGALGLVLDADPDKAVAAVMSQPNRSGKLLDELIRVTEADPQARNGLKAAVRDYLVDKATTVASEKLVPGDRRGPVSQAKLGNIFKEHEAELARVFSPDEMNTLQAGHRALELANIERLRVSSGSDTAQKIGLFDQVLASPLGKGLDAILRLKYGMLKGGGMIAVARRNFSGVGGQAADDVKALVDRAAFDPELMALLLGRDVPIGSPKWNARANAWLSIGEGARGTYEGQ